MNAHFEKRLAGVWLLLSALTVASCLAAHARLDEGLRPNAVLTVGAIMVSLVKVRLVMMEFMELRHAPGPLRWLTDAWLLLTAAVLLGCYFGVPAPAS